jgi:hypothetical protein
MFYVVYPLLLGIILIPDPGLSKERLADFERLHSVVGEQVWVTDDNGTQRVAKVLAATGDGLTLAVGRRTFLMDRSTVLQVERSRDRVVDGLVKGLAFGLVVGLVAQGGVQSNNDFLLQSMVVYSGIGLGLDWVNHERSPVYRAPANGVTAKVSLRF